MRQKNTDRMRCLGAAAMDSDTAMGRGYEEVRLERWVSVKQWALPDSQRAIIEVF